MEDLKFFVDFSIPVMNSTEEITNAFRLSAGNLIAVQDKRRMNRRFVFLLKNIPKTEIIMVQLQTDLLKGIMGTRVSSISPLTFLYDSAKPGVKLSTNSPSLTKEPNVNVIVEFTKPIFRFEASVVDVEGGTITRFKQLSRALYSLTVRAYTEKIVSISVPTGRVRDISGNLNLASDELEVKHYSTPAISTALHSFVTAGILATSLSAAILSLSTSNLGAVGTCLSESMSFAASNPPSNLHGMIGHLQIFVLSNWLTALQPIEYSETIKGLRWLIPHQKLPWRNNNASFWPSHVYSADEKLTDLTNSSYTVHDTLQNRSMQNTLYVLPLNSVEYFTYFLRGEPMSASNVVKKIENYKGWQDLAMNLFWLGVGGGTLILIHLLTLLFLRWRIGIQDRGLLEFPGFELFLLILVLPCISQSSAFLIIGDSTGGIITGALLLAIPSALIFSIILFLIIAIFPSSFAHYTEIKHVAAKNETWYKKLCFIFIGNITNGKWYYRQGLPPLLTPIFRTFFENLKGPPSFIFVDDNDPGKTTESDGSGIGKMRVVSSDYSNNEEIQKTGFSKVVGCVRSSYIIFDLLRRIILGFLSGTYSSNRSSQNSIIALSLTVIQLICLLTIKPFIQRGIHIVESISLLCEIGIFSLCISNQSESKILGLTMLALLIIPFVAHIVNEWYALLRCILKLSQPEKNSFRLGLRFVVKGLVLPFLPRSRISTSLAPNLDTKCRNRDVVKDKMRGETRGDGYSTMTATVVPVLGLGSPGLTDVDSNLYQPGERKRVKRLKLEPMSDLKKLREMAKASFSVESTDQSNRRFKN